MFFVFSWDTNLQFSQICVHPQDIGGGGRSENWHVLLFLDQVLKDSKTGILTMVENYTSGKNPKVAFAKCWFNCKKNYFHRFIRYLLLIAVALFESN